MITRRPHRSDHDRHRRRRGLLSAASVGLATSLLLSLAPAATAVTRVTVKNPGGLTTVGAVNSEHGFPSWYGDKTGTRIEPCLDIDNQLCGFLPGDVPDESRPISFPDNFPGEFFYQLTDSVLDLPGGGRAVLTLGLEAAFANDEAIQGDQVVFARTRIVVKDAVPNATLTFRHPYGELTIDTDEDGSGRLVEDIAPSVGNFTVALKGNFGPFLRWDPAVAPAAPEGYLGDPAIEHKIVGGKDGYNKFSVTGPGLSVETDQFTVSGKIATNTGVEGTYASVHGDLLDVFATSPGTQLQVDGVAGQYETTPMTHDADSERHYARIRLLSGARPASVTVRNLGDKPTSTAVIKLADVQVQEADYDGTTLTVRATGLSYPLTVVGIGQIADDRRAAFTLAAPPATIQVKSATGAPVTFPVTITGGDVTAPGLPPVDPGPDVPPVTDNTPDNPDAGEQPATAVVAPVTATVPGAAVTLDASASTGAATYQWTQTGGPTATLTGATTAKPTVTLPFFTAINATAPTTAWEPVTFRLVVTNSDGEASEPRIVTVPVKTDTLAVTTNKHRLNNELRVAGTSVIDGVAGVRTPATQVVVWNVTNGQRVRLGTSPVDTTGAWDIRLRPGPTTQVTSVLIQTTRGASVTTTLATR